jgi:hypothetical protein
LREIQKHSNTKGFIMLMDQSSDLERLGAKIQQQTNTQPGCLEVIDEL